MAPETVCSGAGGFAASWVVKLLLSNNYVVHGTVRQPGDSKYDHLKKLDLLDYDSLRLAVSGCSGVFHVASPVPFPTIIIDPEAQLLEPAVKGNVLKACVEAKVKIIVVVSSIAAVVKNPNWPKDQMKDESCWSDVEYVKSSKDWFKTQAEAAASEFGRSISELEVVNFTTPREILSLVSSVT